MWSTVSLIVLVVFLGVVVEGVPINDHSPQSHATNTSDHHARRPDYTYTPGVGAHKLFPYKAKWNTARRTCDDDGGHLVIINSIAEAEAVVRLLRNASKYGCYVGAHDLYEENEFVTIHGGPLARAGYNVWRAGEPNNLGIEEDCVCIYIDAKMNDMSCDYEYYFTCELRNVSAPSTVTRNVFIPF